MSQPQPSSDPSKVDIQTCPHLGIEEDPRTCLGYPSHWNYCHHCKPISVVKMSHQRSVCFSSAYTSCPVAASERQEPLPLELRGRREAIK